MRNNPDIASKGKNLLIIAFLIGLFSFSGYVNTTSYRLPPVNKTELVVRSGRHVKRTTHFYYIKIKPSKDLGKNLVRNILNFHNLLIKTKFEASKHIVLDFEPPASYLFRKMLSTDSGKEASHAFRS